MTAAQWQQYLYTHPEKVFLGTVVKIKSQLQFVITLDAHGTANDAATKS